LAERTDTERTVKILLAMFYAAKNHLRAEWGASDVPLMLPDEELERIRSESTSMSKPEYNELLPAGTKGYENQGLG